jgi:uncharacterized damage-inducible protein DinB
MTSTASLLRARFDLVRRDLNRALDQITDDMLEWAPVVGMRTIRGQLFEIAGKEVELLTYAKAGGEQIWIEVDTFGDRESTVAGWREILGEIREGPSSYLDALSEDDLSREIKFPGDWWEGLLLTELPLHEVIRNVAMHEWYHTGQIYSYLWARSSNPYEW